MHPEPADADVVNRMRAAHDQARTALGVLPGPGGTEAWGWRGRTLSRPVTATDGPAWLRLACIPTKQIDRTFWDGSLQAQKTIPTSVPRPRLRDSSDFGDGEWEYRAELYDHVAMPPIAQTPTLTEALHLPPSWWTDLRIALKDIARISTDRYTLDQKYLDWAMPKFLGDPIDTMVPSWKTAHGDLHWANLCSPLHMLDWEGWGLAPTGYDAAMLHSYSLLVPGSAARIRAELADVLETPAGRFAELVTITELLQGMTHGDDVPLAQSLRQHAAHLLGRSVPG